MPNWLKSKDNRYIFFLTGGVLVVSAIGLWAVNTYIGMDNMRNWLLNEENRKLITWIGSGCGVIVIVLWVAVVYFSKPRQRSIPPSASRSTDDIHKNGPMNNIEGDKQNLDKRREL